MKLHQIFLIKIVFYIFCLVPSFAVGYQDGDLIFQESQSVQSKAIKEATSSRWSHVGILFQESGRWLVAEAVQPVRFTPFNSFVSRGKDQSYRIYRDTNLTDQQKRDLRLQVNEFLGKSYDIYFEWTDDRIYCSEFVYKVFYAATGSGVGKIQKFGELNLDGPQVKELIRKRLKDTGRNLNLDEPIVTPASQLFDPKLQLIEQID